MKMYKRPLINQKVQNRKAIAMVELIFAIVIIGITLLSIPNLMYQASESSFTTIQQESIAAAASDLSLILSREWDEVGTTDVFDTPILTTASATASLSTRPGGRSRVYATSTGASFPASAIGDDSGDFDDIDDIDGETNGQVTLIDGGQDLIDINIRIATDVDYILDDAPSGDWDESTVTFNFPRAVTPGSSSSNIKKLTIELTTTSTAEELADKKIVFNAFSANIGSYKLERRELP